jgi:hypothetical protein
MHKRVIGIVGAVGLLLAGIFVWNAEATPLSGSAILRSAANYSLVEKAACGHQGPFSRCPLGSHWSGVGCVPCPVLTCRAMACCPQYPHVCYTNTSPRYPYCCP